MRSTIYKALLAAGALAVAGTVSAAETGTVLGQIQSPVMINQGDAYVPAQAGMQLNPGDQIMVLQGGQALVNYASGCRVELGGNEILRIAAEDACSAPAVAAVNAQVSPNAGGGGAAATGGGAAAAGGAGGAGLGSMIGLGVTLGVAGFAASEVADDDDDNREPISR